MMHCKFAVVWETENAFGYDEEILFENNDYQTCLFYLLDHDNGDGGLYLINADGEVIFDRDDLIEWRG